MVPAGKSLAEPTGANPGPLYSMQWLVRGVQGSVSHVPPPS